MKFSSAVAPCLKTIGLVCLLSSGACVPLARDDAGLAMRAPEPLVYRSAGRTGVSATAPVMARNASPAGWKAVLVGRSHQIDGYKRPLRDATSAPNLKPGVAVMRQPAMRPSGGRRMGGKFNVNTLSLT